MPPRSSGVRILCFLFFGLLQGVDAAYACTSLGTECLNRIYTGSYATESAAEAACNADSSCVAYDWSQTASLGFKCSSTTTRNDHYNEYKM